LLLNGTAQTGVSVLHGMSCVAQTLLSVHSAVTPYASTASALMAFLRATSRWE